MRARNRSTSQKNSGMVVPKGRDFSWPGAVSPPGHVDFERSAKRWLLDLAPARWHFEEVLHRCPADLALLVMEYLGSQVLAMMKHRYRMIKLQDGPNGETARQVADVCLRERQRAEALQRQVAVVEKALREADRYKAAGSA
jgi:hypothetical protein